MPLSCSCDWDYEPEPGQWCFDSLEAEEKDFEPFRENRRKRCCSCNELIDIGAICLKHTKHRYPYTEAEAKITGGEWEEWEEPWIKVSDKIQCEKCGEIWLNLQSVGFECVLPSEDMNLMLKDYQTTYDPQPLIGESRKQKLERIKNRPAKRYGVRS